MGLKREKISKSALKVDILVNFKLKPSF